MVYEAGKKLWIRLLVSKRNLGASSEVVHLIFLGVDDITQVPIAILEPLINEGLDNLSDNLKYSGHENLSNLITYTRKMKNVADIIDNPISVGKNIGDIKVKKNDKEKQKDNDLEL